VSAFFYMFLLVFAAELGDKTQVATAMFAADGDRPAWLVFAASATALVASSAAATLLGSGAAHLVQGPWLKICAGVGFIVIGGLTLWSAFRA
jgi:putative Ca2+/H+ antiporter (TMEM165/GDT1 family)